MKTACLLKNVDYIGNIAHVADIQVDFVTDDSRKVRPGCIFVAVKGSSFDGNTFIKKAFEIGAILAITEENTTIKGVIQVENARKAYAIICANLFDNPAKKLKSVGITGTNGKTTSAFLIKDTLEALGQKTGLIGTVQNMIGSQIIPAQYTTPPAYELNALLSAMVKSGCKYVVMEASSQALAQYRLYGLKFKVGVFTNLTRDHLDYHGTMENYFKAKCLLMDNSKTIVTNIDDEYGEKIRDIYKDKNPVTFSTSRNEASFTAKNIVFEAGGVKFVFVGKGSIERVEVPMPGQYTVHNAMGALIAVSSLGFDGHKAAEAMSKIKGVKGRCEVLVKKPYTVIRDFAHTGDGLENLLSGLHPFKKNRLIVLFGCAGQRDSKKRYEMAYRVAKYADKVIITSDNPRKEPIESTMKECTEVFDKLGTDYIAEHDRRKAVIKAMDMLQPEDMLLLCGKGHEDYQVLADRTLYLDEKEIVDKYIDSTKSGRKNG
jgi:UDP-N-acetylmuramoyl-L-alanyl-D-glutamate--2,6-diaminopimelate ligase